MLVRLFVLGLFLLSGDFVRKSDLSDRQTMANTIESSLKNNVLSKWYPLSFDKKNGGFITTYSYKWEPQKDQRKMIVTQARHTWVNSKCALLFPDLPYYAEGAKLGFDFLKYKMWDLEFGGFFTLVSREGKVVEASKTAYGNAFAIYALAGYYRFSKDDAALTLAKNTFLWLENHSHDAIKKGYFQHLQRDGTPVKRSLQEDSRSETGYKDQNSSIHLLEAFTELYEVWPDSLLRTRLAEMLYLIRDTMVAGKGYLTLFYTPDWKPVSFKNASREIIKEHQNLDHISYGHDVETAYLMLEASHALGLSNDTATIRISKQIMDHALLNGWDDELGGFYDGGYHFKNDGKATIVWPTKNWWAQAEGLNTLLIMADLFPGDTMEYYSRFLKQWNYIDTYLIDHTYGDWYAGGLDKEPLQRTGLKGHLWKGTYHHFRAMVSCVHRLREKK